MDFFEAQDRARRRTKWLLLYFVGALIGIVVSVYLVTVIGMQVGGMRMPLWNPELFLLVAGVTSVLIIGGSLFKSMQLSGGGATVAADLGGRLVDPGTSDYNERKLLNVVQEMAIASGTPVPQVYVMDEELAINAFAAGTDPSNAVIGVTRGCIERLSRAELQGVIAHEFSHILNGDMRLNMRLIGVIFGILILMIIGRTMLYSMRHMAYSSRNNRNGGGLVIVVLVLGIGFFIVGGIGMLFARMIQAAVSRQREFLADSSAVQFTREPDGLAGALKKIGGLDDGSRVRSPKALEASHMFFAEGGLFTWGLATHPPLKVRIKAIQPHWQGDFDKSSLAEVHVGGRADVMQAAAATAPPPLPNQVSQMAATAAVSNLADDQRWRLEVGTRIRERIAPRWVQASQNKDEAQALLFAMLLAEDQGLRKQEIDGLRQGMGSDLARVVSEWAVGLQGLHSADKIALIDLCIPTLRGMSRPEYERFINMTHWLIATDQRVDLFEFMLQHAIARHLEMHFEKRGFPPIRSRRMSDLGEEANVLVTAMARTGRKGPRVVAAFQAAADEWGTSERWTPRLIDEKDCSPEQLRNALSEFEAATPIMKKQILRVCGLAAAEDGILTSQEAELLRTVADAIGASLPPFVWDLEQGEGVAS